MRSYGILAFPAKHSLSPVIHNAGFKELGIDAQYGIYEIPENEFGDFLRTVKSEPISGLSVSLPYKEIIINHLDKVDEDALKIGAVNTVHNKGGFLYGSNTDFIGSNLALKEAIGDLKGKTVVIIGAGGASRGVIYGVLKEGAEVEIYNRSLEKVEGLAKEFSEMFGREVRFGDLEKMRTEASGDILVQSTSIWTLKPGMSAEEIEEFVPREFVERFEVVMDIVYKPLITPLLKVAQELGKTIVTGEKMLLYQAVEQFELWTGKKAPLNVMKRALEDAIG